MTTIISPTDLPVEDLAHLGLNSNQLALVLNLLLLPHLMKVVSFSSLMKIMLNGNDIVLNKSEFSSKRLDFVRGMQIMVKSHEIPHQK